LRRISDETRLAILRELEALGEKPTSKEFKRVADANAVSVSTVRKVWFEAHPSETSSPIDSQESSPEEMEGGISVTPPAMPEKDMPPITAQPTIQAQASTVKPGAPQPIIGAQVAPQNLEVDVLVDTICGMFDARATKAPEELAGGEAEPEPKLPLAITKDERQALSRAWGAFAVKYAPQIADHIVEINMLVVTIGVFGPRLLQVYQYNQYRQRQQHRLREESGTTHGIPHEPVQTEDEAAISRRLDRRLRGISTHEAAYA
jgi:hypothetical protein